MAGERAVPGLGLKIGWDDGSSGYAPDINSALRVLSAVVQGMVVSRTTAIPVTPALGEEGFIYLVPDGAANENTVAVWDEDLLTGTPGWVYIPPTLGWSLYVEDEAQYVSYQGAVDGWQELYQHIGTPAAEITFDVQTASGNFVSADFGGDRMLKCTNSTDIIMTIPVDLVTTGIGLVWRAGTGNVTIAGAVGVTVVAAESELSLASQDSTCAIIKTGTNAFLVVGDLTVAP